MKIYILETYECLDCGGGQLIAGFASKDALYEYAKSIHGSNERPIEHYYNILELEVSGVVEENNK